MGVEGGREGIGGSEILFLTLNNELWSICLSLSLSLTLPVA